jgi:hypothetical protein
MDKKPQPNMYRSNSLYFERVTHCLRKPVIRFGLPSGRQVELLSFHLEPAWLYGGDSPSLIAHDVVRRLYPHDRAVFVDDSSEVAWPAFLCACELCSDWETGRLPFTDHSFLLLCGFVQNVDRGIRAIVADLLSRVDWEANASDDMLW